MNFFLSGTQTWKSVGRMAVPYIATTIAFFIFDLWNLTFEESAVFVFVAGTFGLFWEISKPPIVGGESTLVKTVTTQWYMGALAAIIYGLTYIIAAYFIMVAIGGIWFVITAIGNFLSGA